MAVMGSDIVDYLKKFIGTPYVWGGNDLESGVDCSGLIVQGFKKFGIDLPRVTYDMIGKGEAVSMKGLRTGDLVFFDENGRRAAISAYERAYALANGQWSGGSNLYVFADRFTPAAGEVARTTGWVAFVLIPIAVAVALRAANRVRCERSDPAFAVTVAFMAVTVLWVMLLACMSATVFFSMDSHFNAIFPADQRKRAAEIRTIGQIGAVVADIGERIRKVQAAEAAHLIDSDGWKAYDAELGGLALAARGAQAEIEAALVAKLEERQQGIGEQQERIAGAERSSPSPQGSPFGLRPCVRPCASKKYASSLRRPRSTSSVSCACSPPDA